MNILVVAATAKEIFPFIDWYRLNGAHIKNCDVLITGPGLLATTYQVTSQVHINKPDLVIMAGLAGSFDNKNIEIGTVVSVKEEKVADEMVIEKNKMLTLYDLGLIGKNKFPFTNGWLKNPYRNLLQATGLKTVRAISVNQISTDKKIISYYKRSYAPAIESMEGAALHYICLQEKIQFIQLRAISNSIGERNKSRWNFHDAIEQLNIELIRTVLWATN
jgi:futalosine hydrolase